MKIIKRSLVALLIPFIATLFIIIMKETPTAAHVSAELLSSEVETEDIPLYGEAIEQWDISDTDADVKAVIYHHPTDAEKHLLVISGTGKMKNWTDVGQAPWYKGYSKTLKQVVIESGVKNVGYYAFPLCIALESVTLTSTVTTVGVRSFYRCESLKSIAFPKSMSYIAYYAFSHCTSLEAPDLNGVKRIYDCAFEGCTSFESVTIPKNTTDAGLCTFAGCTSLTEILVEEGSTVYSSIDGNLYSKDGKTLIAYAPGKTATTFEIPDGVTTLADYSLESSAFTSLHIGGSVESVGAYALRGSQSLTSVSFGDGVKTLGSWALAECPVLSSVDLGGVEEIGAYAFCYDNALTEITLSDSVNTLGDGAFYSCKSLKIANLGALNALGAFAFSGCTALETVDLGDSLSTLGQSAFRGCTALSHVRLPASLDSVGSYAFGGCTALGEVTVLSEALAGSLLTVTDGGSLAANAINLCFRSENVGAYVSSTFTGVSPILRSGELMYLYSTCTHTWKKADTCYSCTACGTVRDAHDIVSVGVTVGYDLSVSVYADVREGALVTFDFGGAEFTAEGIFVESLGLWRYTFSGISPQRMGDTLSASLTVLGITLSDLSDYSIVKYCDNVLAMSADELGMSESKREALFTLVYDLLDYGAASQLYTGYKTDAPVNGGIERGTEYESTGETAFSLESINLTDGVYFTAASLWFDSTNRLAFKFKAPDVDKVKVRVEKGTAATVYGAEALDSVDGIYVLLSEHIYATGFDTVYTVTLVYDGTEVQRLTYSVNSYVSEKASSQDASLAALVRATYCYGISADDYASL